MSPDSYEYGIYTVERPDSDPEEYAVVYDPDRALILAAHDVPLDECAQRAGTTLDAQRDRAMSPGWGAYHARPQVLKAMNAALGRAPHCYAVSAAHTVPYARETADGRPIHNRRDAQGTHRDSREDVRRDRHLAPPRRRRSRLA